MTLKETIEKFKEYLIGKKDASVPEGFEPILIENVEELKEMVSYLKQFGGEGMPNLTDEEYAKAIEDAKKAGLEEAKQSGIVVPKEELEGKYTQEEVKAMVDKGILKRERESKIASMAVNEDLKKDLMKLSSDETEYPYTDEGKIKFDAVATRWSLAFIKKEDKNNASMGNGDKKEEENFNPGSGNNNPTEDTMIPRVVLR